MRSNEDSRGNLLQLLARWQAGIIEPREVFDEARAIWLSRPWPKQYDEGFDLAAQELAFMLGNARELGITHDDFPAMQTYLEAPEAESGEARERWLEHLATVDATAREALQEQVDYYGPRSADDEADRSEIGLADPDERRIHRSIRVDPESVWAEVRMRLCAPSPRDEPFLQDLIEDLMYGHGSEFIDRIEELVAECPSAHETVAMAHVGGIAPNPALERFWRLQTELVGRLRADPIK